MNREQSAGRQPEKKEQGHISETTGKWWLRPLFYLAGLSVSFIGMRAGVEFGGPSVEWFTSYCLVMSAGVSAFMFLTSGIRSVATGSASEGLRSVWFWSVTAGTCFVYWLLFHGRTHHALANPGWL